MRLLVLVPSSDHNLEGLPELLLGLRQQTLETRHWQLKFVHCGSQRALTDSLQAFEHRLAGRLNFQTQILPAGTTPGAALNQALQGLDATHLLILQPGFQPQRNLLELHWRFQQKHSQAMVLGSNQFHPQQALSFWGMASQLEQLMFNFYPQAAQALLPYTALSLHNLSLPLELMLSCDQAFESWRFCAWDLGIRLWQQGWRFYAQPDLRTCLVRPLSLETALEQWIIACQQDLARFFLLHPFPLPGWELDWPQAQTELPSTEQLAVLRQQLSASQNAFCVYVEKGDATEQALLQWRIQLAQLWRGTALRILWQSPLRPQRDSLYPLPWRRTFEQEQALTGLDELSPSEKLACARLAHDYRGRSLSLGVALEQTPSLGYQQLSPSALPEPLELVFMAEASFDQLLRAFLRLDQHLPARALLVLFPLSSPGVRELQRLILQHYAWAELESLTEVTFLCRLKA